MSDGPDPRAIRMMFSRVAHRYDLLNRLLSLGQDQRWRRQLRRAVSVWAPPGPVLDLATGTGDVALGFQGGVVVGGDFCLEMLVLATKKGKRSAFYWVGVDAMNLPFGQESFAAVTVAFGLRNFPDREMALAEIYRVLKPDGVLAVLEFHPVEKRLWRVLHSFWQKLVIAPLGGFISGDAQAYRYLPQSSQRFLTQQQLSALGERVGLQVVAKSLLGLGVAGLTVFTKGGKT